MYLLKLRGKLNNMVLKVYEAPNPWYSLTTSSQNINKLLEKYL